MTTSVMPAVPARNTVARRGPDASDIIAPVEEEKLSFREFTALTAGAMLTLAACGAVTQVARLLAG